MKTLSQKVISIILTFIITMSMFLISPHSVKASSYKEDFINALLENEDEWYENWGTPIVYPSALMFTDLNFDGKLEFIMQYGGGSMLNCDADAYYFDGNNICLAVSDKKTANNKGFDNLLTGYYDTQNKKYVLLGESYCKVSVQEGWIGNFELSFNGTSITSDYYCAHYYAYNTESSKHTYYNGASRYVDHRGFSEISEDDYNKINEEKLKNLVNINMSFEQILCLDWENYSDSEKREALEKAYDSFTYDNYTDGLEIYSDYTNLSVELGKPIKIGASIIKNNTKITDVSKVTCSVYDHSILSVKTSTTKDNCRFYKFNTHSVGTTYVTFSDSTTGYTKRVPVTVYDNKNSAYTVSNIPTIQAGKYSANFYNSNGLYIDSYKYSTTSDGTTTVTFDVYNKNYIYGAVEVYNSDGTMTDAIVIDKMTNNKGSIKETVWDSTCYLVTDIVEGDLGTYREEISSKHTHIEVTIPKDGYIKITTDSINSFLVAFLNGIDIAMSIKSVAGDIKGFDLNGKLFSEELTKEIVTNATYAQFIKDESKYAKSLMKDFAKQSTIFSTVSLGNFADSFVNNLSNLKLENLIFDTAEKFGWSTAENLFEYFSGPVGLVMKGLFVFGDVCNLVVQCKHLDDRMYCGNICIQNQSGGTRTSAQVTVNSDSNFDSDTAFRVYEVSIDSSEFEEVKYLNPELYDEIISIPSQLYNIAMIKDGKETQLDSTVEVAIPIPEEMKHLEHSNGIKVCRIEEDGSTTEMLVEIRDGNIIFRTDHFSLYCILGYSEIQLDPNKVYIKTGDNYYEVEKGQKYTFTSYLGLDEKFDTLDARVYYDANGLEFCPSRDNYGDYTGNEFPNLNAVIYNYNIDGEILYNMASLKYINLPMYTSENITSKNILFTGEFLVTQSTGVYEIESKIYILCSQYAGKIIDKFELVDTSVNLKTDSLIQDVDPVEPYTPKRGDVDGDSEISVLDATGIQLHIAALKKIDNEYIANADADKDGDVSVLDATQIQLYLAQLIPEL